MSRIYIIYLVWNLNPARDSTSCEIQLIPGSLCIDPWTGSTNLKKYSQDNTNLKIQYSPIDIQVYLVYDGSRETRIGQPSVRFAEKVHIILKKEGYLGPALSWFQTCAYAQQTVLTSNIFTYISSFGWVRKGLWFSDTPIMPLQGTCTNLNSTTAPLDCITCYFSLGS